MKIIIQLLLLILHSNLAFGNEVSLKENSKPHLFKIEQDLESIIANKVRPLIKDNDFYVTVRASIDYRLLSKKLGINHSDSKVSLPLFGDVTEVYKKRESEVLPTINNVMSSITGINIEIKKSSRIVINSDKLKAMVLEAIKKEDFKEVMINVSDFDVVVEEKPIIPGQEEKFDLKKIFTSTNILIFFISSGLAFLIWYFLRTLNNSLNAIAGQLAKTSATGNTSTPAYNDRESEKRTASSREENSESIISLRSELREILPSLIDDSVSFQCILSMDNEVKLFLILEHLDQDRFNRLKKSLGPEKKQRLDKIHLTSQDIQGLSGLVSDLIAQLKVLRYSPELFEESNAREKLNKLSEREVEELIKVLGPVEIKTLLERVNPLTAVSIIMRDKKILAHLGLPSLDAESVILKNISSRIQSQEVSQIESKNTPQYLSYLPIDLEVEATNMLGIESTIWANITPELTQKIAEFTLGLKPELSCSFLANLPQKLQDSVIQAMPDLRSQQIMSIGIKYTQLSPKLKYDFIKTL